MTLADISSSWLTGCWWAAGGLVCVSGQTLTAVCHGVQCRHDRWAPGGPQLMMMAHL
jgi:hypothetical protein